MDNLNRLLGTSAPSAATLSLGLSLLVVALLTIGALLARLHRYRAHAVVQTAAVLLNLALVLAVMLRSFASVTAPGIPRQFADPFYGLALAHGLAGLAALLFGLFVVLRGYGLVPRALRFTRYKPFMRAAYGGYLLSTTLGVGLFLQWYGEQEMIVKLRAVCTVVLGVLTLGACGEVATNVPAATIAPVAQATSALAATVPPAVQTTSAPVATVAPPAATVAAAPTLAPAGSTGALTWRDEALRSDAVGLQITGLSPAPSGQVYAAWLGSNDASLPLGALQSDAGGATLSFAAPEQQNLLGSYDRVYLAPVPQDAVATASGTPLLVGVLPPQALIHIRHLLVGIALTPKQVGFTVGLRQQADELLRHAQFLQDAFDAGDLALEQVHAEHIINIIRGSEARDANGDGEAQNPGDGFGLLQNGQQDGYIKGMVDHAGLAAQAPDATEAIKLHAGHVQIVGENTRQRVEQVRGLAEQIVGAGDLAATQRDVRAVVALAQQLMVGIDTNGDEQVGPIPGEGGVLTAYQHAQLMASIPLAQNGSVVQAPAASDAAHNHTPGPAASAVAAPVIATAALPTETPATPAPTSVADPQPAPVSMLDFSFAPLEFRVKVGQALTWRNNGGKRHSATAVDGSFDTGLLGAGEAKELTFQQPGSFAYFCQLHGAADGSSGMVGTLIVEP